MIYLHNFSLTSEDIQFLTPDLLNFDYYFIITIWPVNNYEEEQLIKVVNNHRDSQFIFYRTIKEYKLFDFGFHLRQTKLKEIVKHLNNLNQIVAKLALKFSRKKIVGQDIGIYNCSSPTEIQATNYLNEVGIIIRYTLNSRKFGNLSYPHKDQEIFHYFPGLNEEEPLMVPSSHMSVNKIIYEFGQEQVSEDKFYEVVKVLEDLWGIIPKIIQNLDRGVFSAIFQCKENHLEIIVSSGHDHIEWMNICESVKEYPKPKSLTMCLCSQDKKNLPVIEYKKVSENNGLSNLNSLKEQVIVLPKIEPFIKPRHVLIGFSHK